MDWSRLAKYPNPWRASEPQESGGDVAECNLSKNREREVKQLYQEEVGEEERGLAEKLRSYCTHYGQEKKENLCHSAEILLQLGRLYLQKSMSTSGILQKISYIRCYALLNASRVRFMILKCKDKVEKVKDACLEFNHRLLKSCRSSNDAILLEVSERFHKGIRQKRGEVKQLLNVRLKRAKPPSTPKCVLKLEMLANDASLSPSDVEKIVPDGQENEEIIIIDAIKCLNKKITAYYKLIMHGISDECVRILGKPPCKFSIVGLGSLAREETTLYSDFEHVIILEEDVDDPDVLEYFRWFSVVFQVIIIGFGETILPSVTVKCLNDAYSENPEEDWFYDTFTPRGIAFDGMLPHSCNIPLGRQHTTKRCQHLVELIQTPKNMAKYLSHDEALKNGYYLDEVLRQTSLVWGDEKTYNRFVSARDGCCMKRNEIFDYFQKRIKENSSIYVRNSGMSMDNLATIDCKGLFYRSLTVGLGLLSRVYNIPSDSSFCIIQNLGKLSWFTPSLLHNLNYGFAVACEVRLKLYSIRDRQAHEAGVEYLKGLVGEEATFACKNSVEYLRFSAEFHVRMSYRNDPKGLKEHALSYLTPSLSKWMAILSNRGYYNVIVRLHDKLHLRLKADDDSDETAQCLFYFFLSYVKVGVSLGNSDFCFQRAEDIFSTHLKHKHIPDEMKFNIFITMSNTYFNQGRNSEAKEMLEEFFKIYLNSVQAAQFYREFVEAYSTYHEEFEHPDTYMFEKIQSLGWGPPDADCDLIRRCTKHRDKSLQCLFGTDFQEKVASLVKYIKLNLGSLQNPTALLIQLAFTQVWQWWLLDAVNTIEFIQQIRIPQLSRYDLEKNQRSNLEAMKLLCLFRSGKHTTALRGTSGIFGEELHDLCLKEFASSLWRKIIRSSRWYSRTESIVILFWLIHLIFVQKRMDLFCQCSRPTTLLTKSQSWNSVTQFSGTVDLKTANICHEFSFLLLAKSFENK